MEGLGGGEGIGWRCEGRWIGDGWIGLMEGNGMEVWRWVGDEDEGEDKD